jgi:tetratricopeptide (TPR) repeat protein
MGINRKRVGELDQAIGHYTNAIKIDPTNDICLYNAGLCYNIKSDYVNGIEMLESSISKNKGNIYVYLALGDALERQKEIKRAIMIYRELMGLGVTVHGLKEKLQYLENLHEENFKREYHES